MNGIMEAVYDDEILYFMIVEDENGIGMCKSCSKLC